MAHTKLQPTLAQATELGCTIDTSPGDKARFQLPNGKNIKTMGQTTTAVQFISEVDSEVAFVWCCFHVFEKLAVPVLIGMSFLHATEPFTKYTSRLVNLGPSLKRSLRLCAVGSMTNQVSCTINGESVLAFADTGSEIALISGRYATERGLMRKNGMEELELADGSLAYTSGFADVNFGVKQPPMVPCNGSVADTGTVRFHIWEDLQLDVILDQDMVDDYNIFKDGIASLVAAAANMIPSLAPIIHLRSIESSLTQAGSNMANKVKHWSSSISSTSFTIFSRKSPSTSTSSTGIPVPLSGPGLSTPSSRAKTIYEDINQLDQAENRRLDRAEKDGESPTAAREKRIYEDNRRKLLGELQRLSSSQTP